MILTQKRIIKVPNKLQEGKTYYVSVIANNENLEKLNLKKFEENLCIQPSIKYGITCRKNINGYCKTKKNLPKENRFVRTIYWEWQLYNGEWQSDYKDIYKDCYPREYFAPFGIEMFLKKNLDGKEMIITKVMKYQNLKNTINLYLEVFGYCEILDDNFKLILDNSKYIRRNWEILPSDIIINIRKLKNKKSESNNKKDFEQARLDKLENNNPIERNIGSNGFQGYYAYIFEKICVLENPFYGNATYIVNRNDWEKLSKLTKKQLINSNKLIKRIEHNSNWFEQINNYLK